MRPEFTRRVEMQKYNLENMDCADCANRIEAKLNELEYVREARVSFATNTLYVDTQDMQKVIAVIGELEPTLILRSANSNNHHNSSDENTPHLWLLIALIVVFFSGIILLHCTQVRFLHIVAYVFLGVVYFVSGRSVFLGAFRSFRKGQFFDENVLMLVATIAAFFIGAYEEAVSVMLFFATGEFLQDLAVSKSKASIKALLDVAPNVAYVKRGDEIKKTTPQELKIGDILVIKPGEKIPTDGIVIKGVSSLDQRALTGESVPASVKPKDRVLGGSINLEGALEVEVDRLYENSSVAKIIELVQSASANKSQTEKFISVFAKYYTPIVFVIALFVAVIPPLLGVGSFQDWVYRGLVVLMVSCPCALVISVPLGYFGGIGSASKNGILIKGANDLEALSLVKTIAFDKTGTLTKGVFKVTQVVAKEGLSKEDVLRYASCAQSLSNHPIAASIKEAYSDCNHAHHIQEYEEIAGQGVRAICDNNIIIAGNDRILHTYNVPHQCCQIDGTVVHIALNGSYVGHIIISDELKDDAILGTHELMEMGIEKIVILSGDNAYATQKVADMIGCEFFANLLPEDKARIFEELKAKSSGKIAFVGDGINDAPTLASADVGMSMGGASDVSKESADIIITNNSIVSIAKALKIAKKTKSIIWQNIIFALAVKSIFIVLGLFGVATLWEAVFGDVGVALIALANAMRAMRV